MTPPLVSRASRRLESVAGDLPAGARMEATAEGIVFRPAQSPRARVGYHDPCHLAHAQKVRNAPRVLLRALPGVELVDLPNSDWCCGSAGVYNLTHPDMADRQLAQKLDSIERVNPDCVVASNPGCMLHMARGARERGSAVRIVHAVEVLAQAYPPPTRSHS
jgi:glycolate oxidase iron-sulfur subunit